MKRRHFIRSALIITAGQRFSEPVSSRDSHGCCISSERYNYMERNGFIFPAMSSATNPKSVEIVSSTGDKQLDTLLGHALVRVANTFQVEPGFGLYDDSGDGKNAFAAKVTRFPGTTGTVLFGVGMFHEALQSTSEGIGVLAVCAHEFAHILQYSNPIYDHLLQAHPTVKLVELHADYLAGYYLGSRKRANPDIRLYSLGPFVRSLGDTAFGDPGHHGTADERLASFEEGFALGRDRDIQVVELISRGADFVMRYAGQPLRN